MIAQLNRPDRVLRLDPSMKGPLIASSLFHLVLFVMTAVGIPFVVQDKIETITTPITIEVVDLDEMTQTTRDAKPRDPEEQVEDVKPPPQKPRPPEMTADAPPDLNAVPLDKPEEVEESLPEANIPPPVPTTKPDFKRPKPEPETTKTAKPAPQQDFQSLLKNLIPDEPVVIDSSNDGIDEPVESAPSQIAEIGQQLSVSELDALRYQLSQCWNVLAGAKFAEDLVVQVRAYVRQDRTLYRADVLDRARYNSDSHFRAAADAALRALRNPRCTPLALPPEKYNQWKTIVINFDPSEML